MESGLLLLEDSHRSARPEEGKRRRGKAGKEPARLGSGEGRAASSVPGRACVCFLLT